MASDSSAKRGLAEAQSTDVPPQVVEQLRTDHPPSKRPRPNNTDPENQDFIDTPDIVAQIENLPLHDFLPLPQHRSDPFRDRLIHFHERKTSRVGDRYQVSELPPLPPNHSEAIDDDTRIPAAIEGTRVYISTPQHSPQPSKEDSNSPNADKAMLAAYFGVDGDDDDDNDGNNDGNEGGMAFDEMQFEDDDDDEDFNPFLTDDIDIPDITVNDATTATENETSAATTAAVVTATDDSGEDNDFNPSMMHRNGQISGLIARRRVGGGANSKRLLMEYLVKYKGTVEPQWVMEHDLLDYADLLDAFEEDLEEEFVLDGGVPPEADDMLPVPSLPLPQTLQTEQAHVNGSTLDSTCNYNTTS